MPRPEGLRIPPSEEPEKPKEKKTEPTGGFSVEKIKPAPIEKEKFEPAPEGWITNNNLAELLKKHPNTIKKMVEIFRIRHPEWFRILINNYGIKREYLHPDLINIIKEEVSKQEVAPEGWITRHELATLLKVSYNLIEKRAALYRNEHPEWFKEYLASNQNLAEYISPDLVEIIKEKISDRNLAPDGWLTNRNIANILGVGKTKIKKMSESFRKTRPEWFRYYLDRTKKLSEHYHPDLIKIITKKITEKEKAPEGWIINKNFARLLNIDNQFLQKTANAYKSTRPEWFKEYLNKSGQLWTYYHPDLVAKIKDDLSELIQKKEKNKESRQLEQNLKNFAQELADGQSDVAQHFGSLVRVLGSSRSIDILFKFHPEYQKLPMEYVKGTMADYLGDYLITKAPFKLEDAKLAVDSLSELTFQEGLYETLKDNCLQFYFKQRQAGKRNSQEIIYGYLDYITKAFGHLKNKDLDDIMERTILYYDSVLKDFHKPDGFVEALSDDREFPDINQRINMKELANKKRLLIADEMGLGKSASVIMAKEQLRVPCALIVAPSNVLNTWQQYLSEENPHDPKSGGYFKTSAIPRVLRVENPESLKDAAAEDYDYILMSQERLSASGYVSALEKIDYGMLIVDEVHKLKSVGARGGKRAPELLRLAEKIGGENKYLALLSGTPIPNKVEDIAVILKLLYPERFSAMADRDLVYQIVHGDIIDLRSLLLPRMQMKDLEEGVEMPELTEKIIEVQLSTLEKEVYEVLLEEDELSSTEKMKILRQFLLNPELIDATPGIIGAKIEALSKKLSEAFKTHDKVVVFVNDYVEGVIRGNTTIMNKLGLPPDVEVRVIHGEIPPAERGSIEEELRASRQKMIFFVSGRTADVGINFSSADRVFFYNEPWTEYQRRQELGRVYRPGLAHNLESDTLLAVGTIEQGMHEYISRKYTAVEKLLRGIPLTDLEKNLVEKDEKSQGPDLSVNPELAEYYFSSWDKMMKIFGYVKEIGETDFRKFLAEYARDYAGGYADLGNRSYQANANRVAGTVIHELSKESGANSSGLKILDLASGPEMLKQHIGNEYQNQIFSIDINQEHFAKRPGAKAVAGSMLALPFREQSFDFANSNLSFHYSSFAPSKGNFERLQVLTEMNRVLKISGKLVLNLIYSLELKHPAKFKELVENLGFRLVEQYTDEVVSGNQYRSQVITLEKIENLDSTETIEDLAESLGSQLDGLKFKNADKQVKNSRPIITEFKLHDQIVPVNFNESDKQVLEEEQALLKQGKNLKSQYEKIEAIPAKEIIENKFIRVKAGKKYVLFKKLTKGTGAVVVK